MEKLSKLSKNKLSRMRVGSEFDHVMDGLNLQ